MGVAEELKKLSHEIVSSYEERISAVVMIINNTHQMLEDFKIQRKQTSEQLRDALAKQRSLRKKDFDNMMKNILSLQDKREKEVRDLLSVFLEEQRGTTKSIKDNLAAGEKVRVGEFKKMITDIQVRQTNRENEVRNMLKKFQRQHREMSEALRSFLDKGKNIEIKNFKSMLKDICLKQQEWTNEVKEENDELKMVN